MITLLTLLLTISFAVGLAMCVLAYYGLKDERMPHRLDSLVGAPMFLGTLLVILVPAYVFLLYLADI